MVKISISRKKNLMNSWCAKNWSNGWVISRRIKFPTRICSILEVVRQCQPKSTFLSSMKQLPNQFVQSLRSSFIKWIFWRWHSHYGGRNQPSQSVKKMSSRLTCTLYSPHFHGQSLSAPHCHSQVFEEIVIRQCLAFRFRPLPLCKLCIHS